METTTDETVTVKRPRKPKGKRRGNGEGSIYPRRSDGLWVGSANLGWVDGKRKRKTVYGHSEAEVIAKLRAVHVSAAANLPMPADRLTVEAFLTSWLDQ